MGKGQLEFVVVLGIIVVIVVVGYYALQTGIIPNPVASPDVRLVQDSTNNFIRGAAMDTLRKVSDNGGYLEPQASGVSFLGKSVSYWLKDGQAVTPDVSSNIISGINSYIKNNKDNFSKSIAGKDVVFGDAQVSVNILDSQLIITVNMPTTVGGTPVAQPYTVSVPTKIGEVIDFSGAFVQQQAQSRYLEYFILSSMFMSPYDGPSQTVPTFISLSSCGDFVFKSWFDVKPNLEDTIKNTLAHTYMPDKYPMGVEQTSGYLKYAVPEMAGKKHFDLNVSFEVPDSFSLDQTDFQMNPDTIVAIANPIPMTGICVSDPILVKYYIKFPAIVRVRDTLSGNTFIFAVDTAIKDNLPLSWGAGGYGSTLQSAICSAKGCDASVRVVDSAGKAVSGASVSYMGCQLGTTGANGVVSAKAPCGYGPLSSYKAGFDVYSKGVTSDVVSSTQITMLRMPSMNANIYEAVVDNQGTFMQNGSMYFVPTSGFYLYNSQLTGLNPINTFGDRPEMAYLKFISLGSGGVYDRFFNTRVATISGIPEGEYVVGGGLIASDWSKVYGGITQYINITGSMDGSSIYIYLPYSYSFSNLDNTSQIGGGLLLTSMLQKCGMGPISTVPYNGTLPCAKGIDEL